MTTNKTTYGKPGFNQRNDGGSSGGKAPRGDTSRFEFMVPLASPDPATFDTLAEKVAEQLYQDGGYNKNKPAQLRRFYDEIVMWDQKLKLKPQALPEYLPLIRMLNAKVAYAVARDLVSESFRQMLRHLLEQVQPDQPTTFQNLKLFLEAVMGFYKAAESRKN
ncbi:MAG: type III-A CRISPR-associated protein Csm2 [Hahellaceae bacterium]|nr:type III-A CRISPR-associated protein Csm2 [Hahellaceae bacterium]